jgi:hypothetical protein
VADAVAKANIKGAKAKAMAPHPLSMKAVPIDNDCTGDRWTAQDEGQLAKLIAIIAMGQADQAAQIVSKLSPAAPAFTAKELIAEAKQRLTVQEDDTTPRTGYPTAQRDGFIFEAISWLAARQAHGNNAYLKDPHVSATSQGLDGLMIELANGKTEIVRTTIFEDKCTGEPRATFLKVIKGFLKRHRNERSAELVAGASTLLRIAGVKEGDAARLSAAVMDVTKRRYRAAFALTKEFDGLQERQKLFKGYGKLGGIGAGQRVGAGLIVDGKMRDWFSALAQKAIDYLEDLAAAEA